MTQTYRLYEYFLPKHYDLSLTLEREARRFHGTVTITGHKPHDTHPILFHAVGLTLHRVTLDGELSSTAPLAHDAHKITADVPRGDHSITIEFSGQITDPMHGVYPCYYTHAGTAKELLVTQFESHHAREVFPCIDEPEAKATFDLTLITEPDVSALSNMPVSTTTATRDKKTGHDRLVTRFQTTPRMSSYLLAFVVGELHHSTATSRNGTKVSVYSTHSQALSSHHFALDEAVGLLEFYEEYFGVKYPLPKCDHVALPDFAALAMENWGLITYREGYLLASETTPIDQRRYIATVIAHELAHQWFGDLVTMCWWDDLWLNESFANIMEYIALDHRHPDWQVWDDFAAKESTHALGRDQFASIQPVAYHVRTPEDIAAVFDKAILYCKGSRLIRMTIAYIGEDAFRTALQQYFTDFAYANTEGHDLWRAMHAASGKHIESLMQHWLGQSGLPLVTMTTQGNGRYVLSQQRLSVGRSGSETIWPIPLAAADERMPELLHDRSHEAVAVTSPQLNCDGVSHFVTDYDEASFALMRQRLAAGQLSNVERGLLLYETSLLAQSGHTTTARLLELLAAYRDERSGAVWLIIAELFDRLALASEDLTSETTFVSYVSAWLNPAANYYTADHTMPSDNERTTQGIVMTLLVRYQHSATVRRALQQFRQTSDLAALDGNLQPALFLAATRHGTADDLTRLIHLHSTTHDAHLRDVTARALAASRDAGALSSWVNALDDMTTIKPQDVPTWFFYLMHNPASREATWQWLHDHWDWVVATFGNGQALEKFPLYAAKTLAGPHWLRRYRTFFESHDDPTIRRVIQIGIDEINARSQWIERDSTTLTQFIEHPLS